MRNVYLFRHAATGSVVVSDSFSLQARSTAPIHSHPAHLAQIGERRSSIAIRRDLFVPYAVVTGLSAPQASAIVARVRDAIPQRPKHPVAKTPPRKRLPKGIFGPPLSDLADKWVGWTVPEHLKSRTTLLCEALSDAAAQKTASSTPPDAAENTGESGIVIHWERDEFRRVVDEKEGLAWPGSIAHRKLELFRNRFPLVPGLDRHTWKDI